MSDLVVAVLTYRRPDDLAVLLPELVRQAAAVTVGTGRDTSVLVVDNDPEASAQQQVSGFGSRRVRYVHEPVPGIAAARNRALDEAIEVERAGVLVFIDDDERPVDGWLGLLLAEYDRSGAHGVVGPVRSEFTGDLDPWIAEGGFFTRRRLPTGTRVSVAATNNLLLSLDAVRERGLRFDVALGLVGGEDTFFTRQLTSTGGRLVWCAEAMVTDVVPAARMTRKFVLNRAFRYGASASQVEVRLTPPGFRRQLRRARQAGTGLTRLAGGVARLLLGTLTRSRARQAAGARNLARGAGLITGTLGYVPAEYTRQPPR